MRVLVFPQLLHDGEVHLLAIDNSGSNLLSCGKDGVLNQWEVSKLVNLNKIEKSKVKQQIDKLRPKNTFEYDSKVTSFKWSPVDSSSFISGDINGKIYLNNLGSDHKLLYPLHGPSSPIVDMSWSSDGRLISWSSQDGKVHIYDLTRDTYQELTSLLHSEKLVVQQSIEFDPNNKYLVTLGTDSILYIYQYRYDKGNYQFKVLNKITRFMNQNNSSLLHNKISWSANGEFILIPSAKKNQTTLITLISRTKNWETVLNLAGHNSNCEVVQFNPKFFSCNADDPVRLQDEFDSKILQSSFVIASGGSDKTLAVWNASNVSPLFVLKDLVSKSIVDICWDLNGDNLFLASMDGHITIITFEDEELGNKETNPSLYEIKEIIDTKPFNAKQEAVNPRSRASNTVEIIDQKDSKSVLEIVQETTADASDSVNGTVEEVDTSKPKNERQSFVPKLLAAPDIHDPNHIEDILSSAMDERLQSKPDKDTDKATDKAITDKANGKSNGTNGTTNNGDNKTEITKQKITTKNGKKRIQPMLVSNNSNSTPNPVIASTNSGVKRGLSSSSKPLVEYEQPSYNVSDELSKQVKRQKLGEENGKKTKRELEATKYLGSVVINPNVSFAKTRLATPKVRYNFSLTSEVEQDETFVLDIKNGSGNEEEPSRITYFKKDKQIWCDFIPRYIHLAVEGEAFWALSTNDGQILTYSHTSGKRILPPLILGSPVSFLESHGNYLMAITSIGELFVWDITKRKLKLNSPSSINALLDANNKYQDEGLSRSNKITMCSITSSGVPIITLTNGSGYLFNKDLGTWQTVTESWWAFGSHYWDSLNDDKSSKSTKSNLESDESITALLEHKTNEEIIKNTRTGRSKFFNKISKNILMKEGFENLENTVSLNHLENRILCCELLGEKTDFHDFFLTYAKRICELGMQAKVFEVCNELLGPEGDDNDWKDEVCGIKKHDLLKEVILSCCDLMDSQRILTHFAKKAGIL